MHYGRSSWAYAKPNILWIDEDFKGWIDFSFLLCYATGIIFAGVLGDRVDIRKLYAIGLLLTALSYIAIGLIGIYEIHNKWLLLVLLGLNGAF